MERRGIETFEYSSFALLDSRPLQLSVTEIIDSIGVITHVLAPIAMRRGTRPIQIHCSHVALRPFVIIFSDCRFNSLRRWARYPSPLQLAARAVLGLFVSLSFIGITGDEGAHGSLSRGGDGMDLRSPTEVQEITQRSDQH